MGTASFFRPAIGLLLILATMGCRAASPTQPIKVDEFITQIDRLNGQTVSVIGYISECEVLSCRLYRNKAESDEVDNAMSVIRAALAEGATDVSGFPFPNHPSVSIGTGPRFSFFDLRASFYANSYVVITGKATSHCRSEGRFCFDRAVDLDPIAIRKFQKFSLSTNPGLKPVNQHMRLREGSAYPQYCNLHLLLL
ncbi:hypothetical protein SAMN02745824_3343 [Parasphingorhabdus marina DSM 22363]|uniref:Uncharacterized protein n=1 Tax=Parasphingorhabdus marina DSM 22363 TaxID=1123272 RepID=A0A1N6HLF5_9SPHN|nr:hypothetical protein SAMN02745824_3343 [Parasphingorhabdus marina DSM 22363]